MWVRARARGMRGLRARARARATLPAACQTPAGRPGSTPAPAGAAPPPPPAAAPPPAPAPSPPRPANRNRQAHAQKRARARPQACAPPRSLARTYAHDMAAPYCVERALAGCSADGFREAQGSGKRLQSVSQALVHASTACQHQPGPRPGGPIRCRPAGCVGGASDQRLRPSMPSNTLFATVVDHSTEFKIYAEKRLHVLLRPRAVAQGNADARGVPSHLLLCALR